MGVLVLYNLLKKLLVQMYLLNAKDATVTRSEHERQREIEEVMLPPLQHPCTEATLMELTLSDILAEYQELQRKVDEIKYNKHSDTTVILLIL